MRVLLISADFGLGYELVPVNKRLARKYERESGHESVLFQSDWDYPGLARSLGWGMLANRKCSHNCTDGTVKCDDCGLSASMFIQSAAEWLDRRCGDSFNKPVESYFGWD